MCGRLPNSPPDSQHHIAHLAKCFNGLKLLSNAVSLVTLIEHLHHIVECTHNIIGSNQVDVEHGIPVLLTLNDLTWIPCVGGLGSQYGLERLKQFHVELWRAQSAGAQFSRAGFARFAIEPTTPQGRLPEDRGSPQASALLPYPRFYTLQAALHAAFGGVTNLSGTTGQETRRVVRKTVTVRWTDFRCSPC